jgi:DNA polymerase-1
VGEVVKLRPRPRKVKLNPYVMVAIDYAGIEARVAAWASNDENLSNSYWTGYDIHAAWAKWILKREPDNVKKFPNDYGHDVSVPECFKQYRNWVKNKTVFPLTFGSSVNSVQRDQKLKDHVARELGRSFWNQFSGVKEWHNDMGRFYEKHGYVETLFGFRRGGALSWNQIINMPIQGTAGELVLRAGNRLRKFGYQYSLNVHDDLTFILPTRHAHRQIPEICEIMCEVKWKWINTPLVVEVSTGPNWADLVEVKKYSSVDFGHTRKAA